MTYKKKISIIIVNWNTEKHLENCLSSIFSETDSSLIEVIVVDNASVDNSCSMVESLYPQVKLVKNHENVGFAAANNQGFDIAQGEYILLLNSDTVIKERAIEKVFKFAEKNPDVGIIGCRLFYPDGSFQNSCFRYPGFLSILFEGFYLQQLFKKNYFLNWDRYGSRDEFWYTPKDVDCVMGAFMFVRHAVVNEIGYLDTDYFMYGEETDFAYRVKNSGYRIVYFPDAYIIHVHGGSQKSFKDVAWSYKAVNRSIFFFLYKWRPFTAYIGNIIFVFCQIIRIIYWFFNDLRISFKEKSFKIYYLLKATTFIFHFKAIFIPSLLKQKWGKSL